MKTILLVILTLTCSSCIYDETYTRSKLGLYDSSCYSKSHTHYYRYYNREPCRIRTNHYYEKPYCSSRYYYYRSKSYCENPGHFPSWGIGLSPSGREWHSRPKHLREYNR